MKLKSVVLVAFLAISLILGCSKQSTIPEAGVLSPGQVNSSMLDEVVKVKGKVLWVIYNPGGLGGIYLKLGNGDGEVGVRIQDEIWQTFDEKEKAQFKEGEDVIAEGMLFKAAGQLVVIYGKFPPTSTPEPTNEQ